MMDKSKLEKFLTDDKKFLVLLTLASEQGAKKALQKIGLEDENAGKDIHDLRILIDGYRTVKKTATKTIVQVVVIFTLGLMSMGAYMKWWR